MAANPYPYWVTEQSPTHRGPTGVGVFSLAVLAIIVVIALQSFTATDSGARQVDLRQGVSFCEQYKHDPAWRSICDETKRLRGR